MPGVVFVEEGDPVYGWVTLLDARARWADAPDDDEELADLLLAAHYQCVEFAPTWPEDVSVPPAWQTAQLMQARAIWRSATSGDNDGIGPDGYTVTVFPLDWVVQRLLRPKRGKPRVR